MSAQVAGNQGSISAGYGYPYAYQFGNQGQAGQGQGQGGMQQVYVDPETIKQQKASSLSILDNQVTLAKDRAKAEYEAQRQGVAMKADHDISTTTAAIEQAKTQSIFALDQQHQQRKLEIEQRAQEQRLQIESTASQLTMTAQQQRLQREMEEKLAKLQASMPAPIFNQAGGSGFYGTASNLPQQGTASNMPFPYFTPFTFGTSSQPPAGKQ